MMEQAKDFIDTLPRMRLTRQQFHDLPEYSCSYPTGTTPGKTWKRLDGAHDPRYHRAGGRPYWMICQYDPDCPPEAKKISVLRFKPVICVRAGV